MCRDAHVPICRPRISTHTPMLMLMKRPNRRLATPLTTVPIVPAAPLTRLLRQALHPGLDLVDAVARCGRRVERVLDRVRRRLQVLLDGRHLVDEAVEDDDRDRDGQEDAQHDDEERASQRGMWCRPSQSTTGRKAPPSRIAKSVASTSSRVAAASARTPRTTRVTPTMIQLQRPASFAQGGTAKALVSSAVSVPTVAAALSPSPSLGIPPHDGAVGPRDAPS